MTADPRELLMLLDDQPPAPAPVGAVRRRIQRRRTATLLTGTAVVAAAVGFAATSVIGLGAGDSGPGRRERVAVDGPVAPQGTAGQRQAQGQVEVQVRPAGPGDPELGTVVLPAHARRLDNMAPGEDSADLLATFRADGRTLYLAGVSSGGRACTVQFWDDVTLPAGGGGCGPAALAGSEPLAGGLSLGSGWSASAPDSIAFSVDGYAPSRTDRVRVQQPQGEFEVDAHRAGVRWQDRPFFIAAAPRAATTVVALDAEGQELTRGRAAGG